ncbi:hypothetical protein V8J88_13315 [Massilia sp. W12]|uniref:hypothetical protein n=1 Tax=Massilia sp. W12 TaxID=3126507 RepID=UPI0030D30EDF
MWPFLAQNLAGFEVVVVAKCAFLRIQPAQIHHMRQGLLLLRSIGLRHDANHLHKTIAGAAHGAQKIIIEAVDAAILRPPAGGEYDQGVTDLAGRGTGGHTGRRELI